MAMDWLTAHCPELGTKTYVVVPMVPVLIPGGPQTPLIPSKEEFENAGAVLP